MTTFTSKTALVLLDLQHGVLRNYGDDGVRVVDAARRAMTLLPTESPTVLVTVGFRPGHPEVSESNIRFWPIAQRGAMMLGTPDVALDARLEPRTGVATLTKHRVSAFRSTNLEQMLRSQGVTRLVLGGIATSGAVLYTFLDACDADFEVAVLEDCCWDANPVLHQTLVEHLFRRDGNVISSEGIASWAQDADLG